MGSLIRILYGHVLKLPHFRIHFRIEALRVLSLQLEGSNYPRPSTLNPLGRFVGLTAEGVQGLMGTAFFPG